MTDWSLWKDNFAAGYIDCMNGRALLITENTPDGYADGYECAHKVKVASFIDHHPL